MAELRQMLEEKKKQAKNMLEDSSSVESGFGSQGDREGDVDMEFLPGIGSRLNRNANVILWHKQTLQIESLKCKIRDYHFCITFDFEDESYICYAFWVPHEVYIKDFSKFHHLTPVLSS